MLLNKHILNQNKILSDFKNKNFFLVQNLLNINGFNNILKLKWINFPFFFYLNNLYLIFFNNLYEDLQLFLDQVIEENNDNSIIFIYYKNVFFYIDNNLNFLNNLINSKLFIYNSFFCLLLDFFIILKLFLIKIIFLLKGLKC